MTCAGFVESQSTILRRHWLAREQLAEKCIIRIALLTKNLIVTRNSAAPGITAPSATKRLPRIATFAALHTAKVRYKFYCSYYYKSHKFLVKLKK